jgi:hypothetical protein
MIPKAILVGVVLLCAVAAQAVEGAPEPDEQLELACTGILVTGEPGMATSRISAEGAVDFPGRRVRGFGIGSAPIVFVSATELRFGSSLVRPQNGGQIIEGSIDRTTGKTRIVVRLPKEPARILIDMTLDCRLTPSVS